MCILVSFISTVERDYDLLNHQREYSEIYTYKHTRFVCHGTDTKSIYYQNVGFVTNDNENI